MFGLYVSGDVGPLSIYTDKFGRKTWYLYEPPKGGPSQHQLDNRSRFAQAIAAWKALSASERAAFEAASKKAWLPCTGHNVYVSSALSGDNQAVRTLALQTGIALPDVPHIA